MPIKPRRTSKSTALKSAELAFAVPQVVMHRLARMAMMGSKPSDRDRREFKTMFSEKHSSFSQAWTAMAAETFRMNQAIALSLFTSFNPVGLQPKASQAKLARIVRKGTNAVIAKGLAPIHRKAVANSKRLAKTKLR